MTDHRCPVQNPLESSYHKMPCNISSNALHSADPDDWAEPEMLEQLWKKAQEVEADLVWCDFYSDDEKGTHYVSQDIGSEMNDDFVDALANARIMGALWNKLINRRLCINAGGKI